MELILKLSTCGLNLNLSQFILNRFILKVDFSRRKSGQSVKIHNKINSLQTDSKPHHYPSSAIRTKLAHLISPSPKVWSQHQSGRIPVIIVSWKLNRKLSFQLGQLSKQFSSRKMVLHKDVVVVCCKKLAAIAKVMFTNV